MRRITKRMRAFAGKEAIQQKRHHPSEVIHMHHDLDISEEGAIPTPDIIKLVEEFDRAYNAWLVRRGFTREVGRNAFRHRIMREATERRMAKEKNRR